jgi:N-acetyl-anhydromuramyl-L-alanine amidase AmpD
MNMLRIHSGKITHSTAAGRRLMGLTIGLLVQGSIALAQPDYPPAHWVPATNCTKYYTTGYGHNFCVIHDMEGYYWSSISYLNRCDISASIHYLVNGLQNGSDSLGHRENNPDDPPAGDITQSVREEHYAWHARCWNRYMFGTEHEGFVSSPVWFSEEMYQASAALHRHLCYTYGIPRDRNHIIGHDEKRSASWVAWMNVNWPEIDPTCNTHTDPGQYWDWSYFMSLIMGPTIIWQPESLAVNPGSNATFSVTATGNGLLTYQWRFNGTNLVAATQTSYTVTNAQFPDEGSYSVAVSDTNGTTFSDDAFLVIRTLPIITNQPQDQIVSVGQSALFSVEVTGGLPMGFQWQLDGKPLLDATNSWYLQADARSTNAGAYSVVVTNDLGSAVSTNATLVLVQNAVVGDNTFGQGTVFVGSTNLIAVAAGSWHNLGLRADGTVEAWGNDSSQQAEVPWEGLMNALAIAAGGYHSLAIRADGTVVAWGANDYGQTNVPTGLTGVVGIAAGTWHSVALRADGTVMAWGDDSFGQSSVPVGLSNVTAVAAGGNHTLALKADGTVVAWGENTGAEGNITGQSTVPWSLTNVVAIGAGAYHSLAVKQDGTVVAWGDDSQGQCEVPADLTNVVAVVGGAGHTVALEADGAVAAWGENWNGQCNLPQGMAAASGIAAGEAHTIVLLADAMPVARLLNPVRKAGRFSAVIQTVSRRSYALQYKNSLGGTNWTAVMTTAGNGTLRVLSDPAATAAQRFYRMQQW